VGHEAVFYFDVLGFRHMAGKTAQAAVDALSALAEVLHNLAITRQTAPWSHRYSLGDSVFLTHPDLGQALRLARDLVCNLVHSDVTKHDPLLVRGALAWGAVHHVKGIFLTSDEPANLVGKPVVEAVMLEQRSGLKGPRILLSEQLAQTIAAADHALADWQLRPTFAPGVWEVLWLLPSDPAEFAREERTIRDVCQLALSLLKTRGRHPEYGAHYRAFVLLAARCIERSEKFVKSGKVAPSQPLGTFLSATAIQEICDTTSGLPDEYVTTLMRLIESIGR